MSGELAPPTAPPTMCPLPPQGEGYLVAMVHCEEEEEEEGGHRRQEHLLRTHLLHLCHLHLQAKGLSTGYSRDVHGQVQ